MPARFSQVMLKFLNAGPRAVSFLMQDMSILLTADIILVIPLGQL